MKIEQNLPSHLYPCPRCGNGNPANTPCWVCYYPFEPVEMQKRPIGIGSLILRIILWLIFAVVAFYALMITMVILSVVVCFGTIFSGGSM